MEIVILVAVVGIGPVLAAIAIATLRVVEARPGSVRKLSRVDLRAMFVITAGIATMLSLGRTLFHTPLAIDALYAICFLPMSLPMVWLTRYAIEDLWAVSAAKSKREDSRPDLTFLKDNQR